MKDPPLYGELAPNFQVSINFTGDFTNCYS